MKTVIWKGIRCDIFRATDEREGKMTGNGPEPGQRKTDFKIAGDRGVVEGRKNTGDDQTGGARSKSLLAAIFGGDQGKG